MAAPLPGPGGSPRVDALLREAGVSSALGDSVGSRRLLMSALELRPDDGEILISLVQVLRDRPDEALPFARRAVAAVTPPQRRAVAHRLLAELQDDLGDAEHAEANVALALTLAGGDLDSLRAMVRLKRGRPDAARVYARRALRAADAAPPWCRGAAYRFAALISLDIDDRAEAMKSLSRALELDPDDIKALETLVQIHKWDPDPQPWDLGSSRGESRRSSRTDVPDELEALRVGFETSLAGQRRAEAASFADRFSAAAEKAPTWRRFDAYRLSVEMWLELGDGDKTRGALARIEDRDHQALAALRLWHRVYPESPRGPGEGVWVDTIVQLRRQLSDDSGAEAALERALSRFPDDRGVLQVMTDFKLSHRKLEEALVYGKRLLAAYEKASPSDMLTIFRDHTYFAGMKISENEKLQYALQNADIVAQARREREEGLRAARETVAKIGVALARHSSAVAGDPAPPDLELRAAYERVDGSYYLRLSRRPVRSKEEVDLGKALFFDPRLSHDKTMSCASCHQPDNAWTDGRPRAVGRGGRTLLRNTPTLLDLREHTLFFWDGRASRLTDQVLFPIQEHVEMGADLSEILGRLRAIGGYRDAFIAAYKRPANAGDLARALAAFLETLETPADSAFDRGREDGAAMAAPARRGLQLFTGKARCLSCHQGPLFSDHRFHDLGFNPEAGPVDPGRWSVVPTTGSFGSFLTPSLRNVARTAPYMHDGRFTTLAEVVDFYDRGGDRPSVGALLPLGLSVAEKADLVAFLNALSSSLPSVERPVLPADSTEIPTRVAARDAVAPPRAPSATDRREPLGAALAPAFAGTLSEACAASSLDQVVRASRLPVADDAVRVYVYRALAGESDRACAPLRGLQYDFSGVSQSAEFFCLDWYHELDLLRAAADPVDPAVLTTSCRRAIAWSYQDLDSEDVRTVCTAIVRDIARPAAVCAALTPSFIAPRLKSACEREFRLLGGSAYSCPHLDGQSWTASRCEEYSRFHQARLDKDPSVCGKRELCRALAGEAAVQARALEERVLSRACGRKSP